MLLKYTAQVHVDFSFRVHLLHRKSFLFHCLACVEFFCCCLLRMQSFDRKCVARVTIKGLLSFSLFLLICEKGMLAHKTHIYSSAVFLHVSSNSFNALNVSICCKNICSSSKRHILTVYLKQLFLPGCMFVELWFSKMVDQYSLPHVWVFHGAISIPRASHLPCVQLAPPGRTQQA